MIPGSVHHTCFYAQELLLVSTVLDLRIYEANTDKSIYRLITSETVGVQCHGQGHFDMTNWKWKQTTNSCIREMAPLIIQLQLPQ